MFVLNTLWTPKYRGNHRNPWEKIKVHEKSVVSSIELMTRACKQLIISREIRSAPCSSGVVGLMCCDEQTTFFLYDHLMGISKASWLIMCRRTYILLYDAGSTTGSSVSEMPEGHLEAAYPCVSSNERILLAKYLFKIQPAQLQYVGKLCNCHGNCYKIKPRKKKAWRTGNLNGGWSTQDKKVSSRRMRYT